MLPPCCHIMYPILVCQITSTGAVVPTNTSSCYHYEDCCQKNRVKNMTGHATNSTATLWSGSKGRAANKLPYFTVAALPNVPTTSLPKKARLLSSCVPPLSSCPLCEQCTRHNLGLCLTAECLAAEWSKAAFANISHKQQSTVQLTAVGCPLANWYCASDANKFSGDPLSQVIRADCPNPMLLPNRNAMLINGLLQNPGHLYMCARDC